MLALFCLVALGLIWFHRADDEIRRAAERILATSFPHLSISVRSARYIQGVGVELSGVDVRPHSAAKSPTAAIAIERLRVCCTPTLPELLRQEVQVDSIWIQHLTFRATRYAGGAWSFSELVSPQACQSSIPKVLVESATLEVIDESKSPPGLWQIRGIEARLEAADPDQEVNRSATGERPKSLQFAVSLGHEPWRHFIVTGEYSKAKEWAVAGQISHLAFSPALRTMFPAEWSNYEKHLGPLQADMDLSFSLEGSPQRQTEYHLAGKIKNGRMDDPRLTYPITDLQAEFELDRLGPQARRVTARYGGALVSLALLRPNQPNPADLSLEGSLIGMQIDEKLITYLPHKMRLAWERFRPMGHLDVKFSLRRQANVWVPNITLDCKKIEFLWHKFPYPLSDVQGKISFSQNRAQVSLRSLAESKPVEIQGEMHFPPEWPKLESIISPSPSISAAPLQQHTSPVTDLTIPWQGWFMVRTLRPCELEPALIRAFAPKVQEMIRAFQPQGHFVMGGQWSKPGMGSPIERIFTIEILDGSIRHAAFPYPLTEVRGRIEAKNDQWHFHDLAARNDSGYFSGEGDLEDRKNGRVLQLRMEGNDVPLEDELCAALNQGAQAVWQHLQPRGTVDHVRVEYARNLRTGESSIFAKARKAPGHLDSERRTLQMKPRSFPYDLQDVSGRATYQNGRFQVENFRAQHGDSRVTCQAEGNLVPNRWGLQIRQLHFDQLQADSEFLGALPPKLREIIVRHQVSGSTCVRGNLAFQGAVGNPQPQETTWDLAIDMENGQLHCGLPLKHVCGEIRITGNAVQDQFQCQGELDLDSTQVKQFHLSQIRGPFSGNANLLLLGRWSAQDPKAPSARSIVARINQGDLALDGLCRNDQNGSFELACALNKVDVEKLMHDLAPASTPIRGSLASQCRIRGNSLGRHSLGGEGTIELRQTDLYQLPVVLALVQQMRHGRKDPAAFDSSDIAFRIQGEHIYLDRIDLHGDALTLKGAGELNARHEIDLNFYTVLGREDAYLPAVRPLLGMASQRFLLVKVGGTLENPKTSREILPELNETLKRIFPDAAPPRVPNGDILPAQWEMGSNKTSNDQLATP